MIGRDARLSFSSIIVNTVSNSDDLIFRDAGDGQYYRDNVNDVVKAAMAAGITDAIITNSCNFTGAALTFGSNQIPASAYPAMVGATGGTGGTKGAVTPPAAGEQGYVLLGNAVWTDLDSIGIDHGGLAGLSDDDHPQYHKDNDALVAASASCTYIIVTPGSANIGIKITGDASQSAALFRVEDSGNNKLVEIDNEGELQAQKWFKMGPSVAVTVSSNQITPTQSAVYVTGTDNTIDTINNAEDGRWLLIRNTGSGTLTLQTGGNILFGKTVTSGRLVLLYYYGPSSKWIDYS